MSKPPNVDNSIPGTSEAPLKVDGGNDKVNEKQIRYNSQLAISEKDFSFLSVQILRIVLSQLVDLGMEIIVFRGDKGYHFKDFAAQFWHNWGKDSSDSGQ